jgi:hypothetical protein
MACKDSSTDYLKTLGYNVIRHPRAGIVPFGVIGSRGKASDYLGHIQHLLQDQPQSFPELTEVPAANVNGTKSDSLDLAVGLNILGNIIGAMGGNLGITTKYTNAEKIQFKFVEILEVSVPLLAFGTTIKNSTIDINNPFIEPYLKDGKLLMIANILKSNKIQVDYQKDGGIGAEVKIPVIQEVVGGEIKVEASSASTSSITFTGPTKLAFGFKAFRIGLDKEDGTITLEPTKPGANILAGEINEDDFDAALLTEDGLLDI